MGLWGAGMWGGSGWGGPSLGAGLELRDAQPIAENKVRLTFNLAPLFNGILTPSDASNPSRFTITTDPSSLGADGLPPRPVTCVEVSLAPVPGSGGTMLDLITDRSFSPFPSRYRVSCTQLRAAQTGVPLDPSFTSFAFDGLAMVPASPLLERAATTGDFANPQTVEGLGPNGVLPPEASLLLGTFPIDGTGDYGIDQGLRSYKKRVIRRLTSEQGAFAHLAQSRYGVGVPGKVKTLARVGVRESLAAEAEAQIRLEPETRAVSVTVVLDPLRPEVTNFVIRAQTNTGQQVSMQVPFSPNA